MYLTQKEQRVPRLEEDTLVWLRNGETPASLNVRNEGEELNDVRVMVRRSQCRKQQSKAIEIKVRYYLSEPQGLRCGDFCAKG